MLIAAVAAIVTVLASMERARRRRVAATAVPAPAPLPAARPAPAPVVAASEARASATDRHARATRVEAAQARPPRRQRSRGSAVAAATVAVVALTFGLFHTSGAVPGAAASLSVERLSTGDGPMVVAHARNFTPDTPVELHWHQSEAETVHAVTSSSGEVVAAISLPAMDAMNGADATPQLVATDGTHEVTASVTPVISGSGGTAPVGGTTQLTAGSIDGMTLAAMPARRPRKATSTPTSATAPTATQTPAPTVVAPSPSPTPQASIVVFGRTSDAGFNDSSDWGYLNGAIAGLPSPGSLASLSVDVGATSATAHIRLALYADASGAPGALIAQTNPAAASVGWNTLPTTTNPLIAAGPYWIVAQTDDPATVYRMASGLSAADAVGWAPQAYGGFPASVSGWLAFTGQSFSMYGTVVDAGAVGAGGGAATPPPVQIPVGETVTPANTATFTSTPVAPTATAGPATATAVPPTATATSGSGFTCPLNPAGGSQCGTPRYFCDTWSGGFCDDFRNAQTATHIPFPRSIDPYSVDLMDATDPSGGWTDCCTDGPFMPASFLANEHFMIAWTSANFGDAVIRVQQPVDFAGRTGHIHFDVDLKTRPRGYVRMTLSPDLTKRGIDDRFSSSGVYNAYPANGLDLWLQGSQNGSGGSDLGVKVTESRNGGCGSGYCYGNVASATTSYPNGHDNVRDGVDVYVSRTHLRVVVNGTTVFDQAIPDIGFDRSYLYFQQAQYNPCKEGAWPAETWPNSALDQCSMAAQMFHWDNIAFDGPTLPKNGMTPSGYEDIVFNAFSVSTGGMWNLNGPNGKTGDCTVKGVPASPNGVATPGNWITWVARLPANTAVTLADVQCVVSWPADGIGSVQGLEIVQQ